MSVCREHEESGLGGGSVTILCALGPVAIASGDQTVHGSLGQATSEDVNLAYVTIV